MSTLGAFAGWIAAGIAVALLVAVRRMLGERMAAVARASHELRGPLAAARLGLSLGNRGGELSAGRLRAIDAELGRAALALQDLAEVRRGRPRPRHGRPRLRHGRPQLRHGRLQLRHHGPQLRHVEPVDVGRVVADSVEAWRATADAAGVVLREPVAGPAVAVWGDRLRLAQAVGNLLANAIEHGGATVEVRVARRADVVRVEISDDGRGLPAPVAELTRKAWRARGPHGHGLAIASSIAEAHRGRLAAAPTQVGARLVLELPAAGPSRRPRSTRAVTPAPNSRPSAAR